MPKVDGASRQPPLTLVAQIYTLSLLVANISDTDLSRVVERINCEVLHTDRCGHAQ